jgi:hypothetical protein
LPDFHKPQDGIEQLAPGSFFQEFFQKACPARVVSRTESSLCTIFGQGVVDGLHSIENTTSCKSRFSIDEKNRKRKTRSFFDSFLSFSGWCGVRGSSEVTF